MISVKNLKYKYKNSNKFALSGIDFSVSKGEIVAVIGPNGAGKSTLIKVLLGILVPQEGTVRINNQNPYNNRIKNNKNIGVVFGNRSMFAWELSAYDTFILHKSIYSISDYDFDKRIRQFDEIFSIKSIWKKQVRLLSLGQRMKLEIVLAFLHNPDIIYMDEPTIGLDMKTKNVIREFIRHVNSKLNTTILLSSHDINDIEYICRDIIIIDKGKLLLKENLEDFINMHNKHREIAVRTNANQFGVEISDVFSEFNINEIFIKSEFEFVLKVDISRVNIPILVGFIYDSFDVNDLSINSTSLENIINMVYHDR